MLLLSRPSDTSEATLPNPNGYDDFLRAGANVSPKTSEWKTLSLDQLRQLIETNQPALELIQQGLAKECHLVPFVLNDTNSSHLNYLAAIKAAGQAICALSRLQLLEGHTNKAARLAVECIRFGHESTRGGIVIDSLVGNALVELGQASLLEALPGIDATTAREIAGSLERIHNQREPFSKIWQREGEWAKRGYFGPSNLFKDMFRPLLQRETRNWGEKKFAQTEAQHNRITLRVATRAYELEHGHLPPTTLELVPHYLKSTPMDPTTDQPIPIN
jgi:hypothetical protein